MQQIIKHLQESFCNYGETEEEILKQYRKINVTYNHADLVQVYFKALQDARTILLYLQGTVVYKVIIFQGIYQFNNHMNLNEAVDDWKKKTASPKTWNAFKAHFTKEVTKNHKHSSPLKETGSDNQFKEQVETNRNNTETVKKFQIEQSQTIKELTTHLDHPESLKSPT